jgi:hypothetical protein
MGDHKVGACDERVAAQAQATIAAWLSGSCYVSALRS